MAFSVVNGERPLRPENLMASRWLLDPIWDIFTRCWDQNPQSRPPISSLHRTFAESRVEHKRNISVTGNGRGELNAMIRWKNLFLIPLSIIAITNIRAPPRVASPEPVKLLPDTPPPPPETGAKPSPGSPREIQTPRRQRPLPGLALFMEVLAGIRRLMERMYRR
jgi:hypothetical protein